MFVCILPDFFFSFSFLCLCRAPRGPKRRLRFRTRGKRRDFTFCSPGEDNLPHAARAAQYLTPPSAVCWPLVPGRLSSHLLLPTYQCCSTAQAPSCWLSRTPHPQPHRPGLGPRAGPEHQRQSSHRAVHAVPRQRRRLELGLTRQTSCRAGRRRRGRRRRRWGRGQ